MELWIRNQDRKKLTKIICVEYGEWNKEHRIYANGEVCGKYEAKERCIEILDEIQKLLKSHLTIKDNGKIIGSFEDTIIREGATYELKELSTYVYEMPKE